MEHGRPAERYPMLIVFLWRLLLYLPAGLILLSITWVTLYKFVPVRWTPLMLKRSVEYRDQKDFRNQRTWVDIDNISEEMVKAVIASEDGRFIEHNGFDFEAIREMKKAHDKKGTKIRGCSTISQQTAKNCFTFGSKTWFRKGVEAYYTILIEMIWGKKRIMEVYLNVAETGKGLYGVEAVAEKYFNCTAAKLTKAQAVSIACVLPNPLVRNPKTVSQKHRTKYNTTYRIAGLTLYPF